MSLSDYLTKNYLDRSKKKEKGKPLQKRESSMVIDDEVVHSMKPKKIKTNAESKSERKDIKTTGAKGWTVAGTNESVTIPEVKDGPKMASGANPGLQTGAQVAEQIRVKEDAEKKQLKNLHRNNETVYRDSSGQKVDMNKIREGERRRDRNIELEKQRRRKELNMGLVQKLQIEKAKEDLVKAKNSPLTRHSDDKELNENLKKKEFEDDPLLSFNPSKSKKYVSLTGRKLYKGGFPENRFGIAPGYRWDGVDRSNGFEKKWFKAQVEKERKKTLSYTMQEEY